MLIDEEPAEKAHGSRTDRSCGLDLILFSHFFEHQKIIWGHNPILMISLKVKIRWQSKKLQIQGAQRLRNKAYLQYAAVTKDAAQRRSWT
ncbi:MAG: hypothetical protein ACE5NJ_05875, partial [Thermodesulfobacteriota bacterium]